MGANYIHVRRDNIAETIDYLRKMQSRAGIFYNIAVLPYRGKKWNPELYVTIKIG